MRWAALGLVWMLGACSQSTTTCNAGCLCYGSDESACKANGCPWWADAGLCYNGAVAVDGGAD